MKKVIAIFMTIISTLFVLLFFVIFFSNYDNDYEISDLNRSTLNILAGIGISFLYLVNIVFGFLSFCLLFLIPMIIYRFYRDNENDIEFVKYWGSVILIVLIVISIFSIAGVQLRGLKKFDDKPTEVRIVEP
jgi:ABC-type phosphate transport system permease subunit